MPVRGPSNFFAATNSPGFGADGGRFFAPAPPPAFDSGGAVFLTVVPLPLSGEAAPDFVGVADRAGLAPRTGDGLRATAFAGEALTMLR